MIKNPDEVLILLRVDLLRGIDFFLQVLINASYIFHFFLKIDILKKIGLLLFRHINHKSM